MLGIAAQLLAQGVLIGLELFGAEPFLQVRHLRRHADDVVIPQAHQREVGTLAHRLQRLQRLQQRVVGADGALLLELRPHVVDRLLQPLLMVVPHLAVDRDRLVLAVGVQGLKPLPAGVQGHLGGHDTGALLLADMPHRQLAGVGVVTVQRGVAHDLAHELILFGGQGRPVTVGVLGLLLPLRRLGLGGIEYVGNGLEGRELLAPAIRHLLVGQGAQTHLTREGFDPGLGLGLDPIPEVGGVLFGRAAHEVDVGVGAVEGATVADGGFDLLGTEGNDLNRFSVAHNDAVVPGGFQRGSDLFTCGVCGESTLELRGAGLDDQGILQGNEGGEDVRLFAVGKAVGVLGA